jgi:hypothetical protein
MFWITFSWPRRCQTDRVVESVDPCRFGTFAAEVMQDIRRVVAGLAGSG